MKQVIDRGYAASFEDGLKIEHEACGTCAHYHA
jgi:hypothetical protein